LIVCPPILAVSVTTTVALAIERGPVTRRCGRLGVGGTTNSLQAVNQAFKSNCRDGLQGI